MSVLFSFVLSYETQLLLFVVPTGVSVRGWRPVEVRARVRLATFSKEVREAQVAPFVIPYRTEPFVGVKDL
jgi:hypothetical protein